MTLPLTDVDDRVYLMLSSPTTVCSLSPPTASSAPLPAAWGPVTGTAGVRGGAGGPAGEDAQDHGYGL
ncbi:hypothetical protein ACZ91_32195 [Streptomyces regensis]|nr:hypothetical protein ACZ91_32195 [Streptomyces regensis]KOG74809.1 hypothetical protein ADK77_03795 [Streptomyces antibioticus]